MERTLLFLLILGFTNACAADGTEEASPSSDEDEKQNGILEEDDLKAAYFASGCFWCVEHIYEEVEGVEEAISGFAGGSKKDPNYREVASGATNHAEAVKVLYDPEVVSFETLVEVYYASQDPTTEGQDPDFGPQYRSIIFYLDEEERAIAERKKDSVARSGEWEDPIVTEIEPLEAFYEAGEKHQDYVEKHPDARYVQTVSNPRSERFKEKMPELLK